MSIHAYKIDDGVEDRVVVHRNYDGVHDDSTTCWCCPEVITADSIEPANDIVERLEKLDG